MLYAKVNNDTKEILEYPVTEIVLKQRLVAMNVSFPSDLTTVDLRSFGYYQVPTNNDLPQPPAGYRTILGQPIWDGDYLRRTWTVIPINPHFNERMWRVIRNRRNQLLKESDWTELPSVRSVRSPEWAEKWDIYRQKLRDVTKIDYPTLVKFPEKPNEIE